jgi:hypothetical protein
VELSGLKKKQISVLCCHNVSLTALEQVRFFRKFCVECYYTAGHPSDEMYIHIFLQLEKTK